MYTSFSIIFTLAALLSFVNYKWLKLPSTIGQLLLALGLALIVLALRPLLPNLYGFFCNLLEGADFSHILLDIMLGFLLFAGALHVDISELKKERWPILLFATIGVLISTFLVGCGVYFVAQFFQCSIPFIHCLLFGALISPTDPIAVLALLKNTSVKKSLQLKIEGESLFNDGIGVIVFTAILIFAGMDGNMPLGEEGLFQEILFLFAEEVLLGLFLGWLLGISAIRLMKSIHHEPYLITILSLAVVFGGYSLAGLLHTSGPLAMVVAGLIIGHSIKLPGFAAEGKKTLIGFWNVLDESLNGVLFVFLGFAISLIQLEPYQLIVGLIAILILLLSRFIAVFLPYALLKHQEDSWIKTTLMLTWGGLRGGISLALAFSLPPEYSRETILLFTYVVVIWSIIAQGLTIPKLIQKLYPSS